MIIFTNTHTHITHTLVHTGTMTNGFPLGYFPPNPTSIAKKGVKYKEIGPGFSTATITTNTCTLQFINTHGKTLYTTTLTNPHNTYTQTNHNIPYYTLYNLHIYTQYELFQLFVYGALCFIVGICIGIFRNSLYSVWKKYFCCFTVCFKACSPNSGTTSVYSSELQISGTSTHNMTSYGLKEREEDSNL